MEDVSDKISKLTVPPLGSFLGAAIVERRISFG